MYLLPRQIHPASHLWVPTDENHDPWLIRPEDVPIPIRGGDNVSTRSRLDESAMKLAAECIQTAKRPLIIASGGVIDSEAAETLRQFVKQTGIPLGETMAGKGNLGYDHPMCMGAVGATGTLAANARSLGARVNECETYDEFTIALAQAKENERTTVIYIQNDRYEGVPGYESWWDVPVAGVSQMPAVQAAREEWAENRAKERYFL